MEYETIKENENLRKHLHHTLDLLVLKHDPINEDFYIDDYKRYKDSILIDYICDAVYNLVYSPDGFYIEEDENFEEKIYCVIAAIREEFTIKQGIYGNLPSYDEVFDEIKIRFKAEFPPCEPSYEPCGIDDCENDIL